MIIVHDPTVGLYRTMLFKKISGYRANYIVMEIHTEQEAGTISSNKQHKKVTVNKLNKLKLLTTGQFYL
jgi:hypothetical protein